MTTLEKIRAEIKTKYDSIPWRDNDYNDGWVEALEWVYDDVLDKYAEPCRMTTLQRIRAEIESEYNKFRNRSEVWDERANGIGTALEIIDKYAEQDKLMIIEANVNGYTQGLKDAQRQSCDNCKQDRKECGNDDHYGFCQNWEYAEQEPCEDYITLKMKRGSLKSRQGDVVIYNVMWLKDHWQQEMDIVCGVKPCEDAVSRQAVQDTIEDWLMSDDFDKRDLVQRLHGRINELPSVQPKRNE